MSPPAAISPCTAYTHRHTNTNSIYSPSPSQQNSSMKRLFAFTALWCWLCRWRTHIFFDKFINAAASLFTRGRLLFITPSLVVHLFLSLIMSVSGRQVVLSNFLTTVNFVSIHVAVRDKTRHDVPTGNSRWLRLQLPANHCWPLRIELHIWNACTLLLDSWPTHVTIFTLIVEWSS